MHKVDDDGYGSGLSGWAWYELGRDEELAHQGRMEAASTFAARLRGEVPVNVGAVMAENRALRQQNQELWERNQKLLQHNRRLCDAVTIWEEDYETLKSHVRNIHAALKAIEDGQSG